MNKIKKIKFHFEVFTALTISIFAILLIITLWQKNISAIDILMNEPVSISLMTYANIFTISGILSGAIVYFVLIKRKTKERRKRLWEN